MNHELAREVWQRLSTFEIDDSNSPYPFSARLAKENGWSCGFARRVIDEYKRYLLLCVAGDTVPCPSEHVDQAWHLHLTYTRSYWKMLCGEILGRPIHHEPTRGGPDEHRKHVRMYEQTLASYREFFGREPPLDIWPPAKIRFGDDVEHQRVNVRRNWIVPKWVLWPLTARRSARAVMCAGLVAFPLATINPLQWHGQTFIAFYIAAYVLALIAGLVLRHTLRSTSLKDDFQELTPQEAACLAYNQPAAINAAICQMVQQGTLQLASEDSQILGMTYSKTPYLTIGRGLDANASRLEQELYKAAHGKSKVSFHDLHQAGLPVAAEIERGMIERGLVEQPENTLLARWLPFMLMGLLLAMGLAKVAVGVWREKPVLYLAAGCVVTAITAFYFLRSIRRTRSGDNLLKLLRARHANLSAQGGMTPGVTEGLSPTMLAMAVGLFGAGVLASGPLAGLQSMWIGHQQTYRGAGGCGGGCTSGSGCSTGCSSGCGGGGGCGGGCGGGGCGGCGGS